MMEDKPQVDQHELDLLVDGEINEDRRRLLLSGMDQHPESWRQLALTFVENQMWEGDFSKIVLESSSRKLAKDDFIASPIDGNFDQVTNSPSRFRYRNILLTIVVMLALGTGYFMGGNIPNHTVPENLSKKTEWPDLVILPNQPSQSTRPKFTVDNNRHENIPVDLKMIDWDDRPPRWSESLNPSLPKDFLNALRKSGLAVEEKSELILMLLEDGRSVFVPVNNVRMKYVGNNIYQ